MKSSCWNFLITRVFKYFGVILEKIVSKNRKYMFTKTILEEYKRVEWDKEVGSQTITGQKKTSMELKWMIDVFDKHDI